MRITVVGYDFFPDHPLLKKTIPGLVSFGWATATVALALAMRLVLRPLLGENRPFLTFLAAVAVAAWIGGRRTAIFAIVLSYLAANYFFMPPVGEFNFDHTSPFDWGNVLVFIGLSLFIVEPILTTQRAQRQAEASATEVMRLLAAAKEAARQKDRFLATLAHELRNPLSAIGYGLSYWPQVMNDAAEMDDLRTIMTRQARTISRLVDDMMDVVRFDHGALRLHTERVDIATLIGHVIESIRENINAHGHQLQVDLPADPILIDGDAVRLNQVFSNILDNAIKYTSRDGMISITASRQGNDAVVRIGDNGPGICESMLATVFEMFSQAESTLDRSAGGLGIGLFLVKQFVALHGGTVEARSDGAGQGSEFIVTLPALPARAKDGDLPQLPKLTSSLARHRILVVDDIKDSAETLAKTFCSMGQDATALYDGETAIEWILTHQPEVVFLDIAMPGLDGYEVARRLREHDELCTVLVALTAFGQQEDRTRALKAGFDFHLTKPADIELLEEVLLMLPQGRPGTAEAALM